MRIAAIYDIHANLPALEAVLQEIRQANVDCVVVGGDVVPGPLPLETIQCLLDLDIPAQFIHGNVDREVPAQMSGFETDWYRTALEQWREPVRWTAQQQVSDRFFCTIQGAPGLDSKSPSSPIRRRNSCSDRSG
jgi:predicted phosphodiesterase